MNKIPTLFQRDENHKVIDKVTPGCEWVLAGEGIPTEKLDGTNIRITIRRGTAVRVEKRRNPSGEDKSLGIVDGWYVDACTGDLADKHIFAAVRNTPTLDWKDGEWVCEAIGPKIQGNPLEADGAVCVPLYDAPRVYNVPRGYRVIGEFLARMDSRLLPGHLAEGIVFHHLDGRMAKIKRKDYPLTKQERTTRKG